MYDMKSVIAVVAVLFAALCCTPVGAKDRAYAAVWDSANTAYIGADYEAAIKNYEQLLDSGYESARLYFNLGNAYFKKGMNGRAILNYNKALKLAPGNDDIRYNLSLANAYVQDKIEEVPVFFLKRWLIDLGNRLSGNTWAVLSLVFFALLLIGVGTYLLLRRDDVAEGRILRSNRLGPVVRGVCRLCLGGSKSPTGILRKRSSWPRLHP